MASTATGITVPAGGDPFDPQGDMVDLANSLRSRIAVPVVNATARTALLAAIDWTPTAAEPLRVWRGDALPAPREEWYDGTRWHVIADTTLGRSRLTTTPTVAGTPSWTTLASVTATSLGGLCVVRTQVTLGNGNSGVDRTGSFRVRVDGAALSTPIGVDLYLRIVAGVSSTPQGGSLDWESQPAAGEHTWELQANGSAGGSVVAHQGVITVIERP
ncbi:hypothetical protein [Cellulomonas hominis]|uniref:hypothetical protein n=1 Tax=Cellulomonas hominis TaxID=156981 RepID=UPI0014444538|nr:hypothetical protein [Cellulomonas hominis]NKY08956.1 hypothetical protein [Cellulomonas hominis]